MFLHIWVISHVHIHPTQGSQAYFPLSKATMKIILGSSKMKSTVNVFNPLSLNPFLKMDDDGQHVAQSTSPTRFFISMKHIKHICLVFM